MYRANTVLLVLAFLYLNKDTQFKEQNSVFLDAEKNKLLHSLQFFCCIVVAFTLLSRLLLLINLFDIFCLVSIDNFRAVLLHDAAHLCEQNLLFRISKGNTEEQCKQNFTLLLYLFFVLRIFLLPGQ